MRQDCLSYRRAFARQGLSARRDSGPAVTVPFYRPELDTLRFLAFLGVFAFHIFPHDPGFYEAHHFLPRAVVSWVCALAGAGAFGVDLFFVLSAYLITVLLLREQKARGDIDVKSFYVRRICRIWPLYFFFIAVAAVIPLWDRAQSLGSTYIAGYLLLAGNWVYAVKGMPASVAIPLWSISVEEQFYLVWPLILRRMSRMRIIYATLVVLGLGNIARIALVYMHASGAAAEYNTFVRIDAIAFGILIACLFGERSPRLGLAGRLALFSVSLSLWLVISTYAGLNVPRAPAPVLGTILGRPAIALASTALLIAFIGAPAAGVRFLTNPMLSYLGKVSYGLYVYHMFGLLLARHILGTNSAMRYLGYAALGLLLTIALSSISYRWLESPFLRLKNRFAVVQSRPV
jgi:peptidoglycan/LPS O-acetylase OafA/YrhL